MRTKLAAGLVGAATVLTLVGGPVAVADGKDNPTLATDTPAQTHDASPWMHDAPARTYDTPSRFNERRDRRHDRRNGRNEGRGRYRNNPLRLTACALKTALGALTGRTGHCGLDRFARGGYRNNNFGRNNNFDRGYRNY
ncbi:hypothetical protein HXP44_22970 [Streptomyces sioyaensis]|uniref:Uncharacterized protein n=1 Tax=Streptomyces sioyaensis TaxID=67364 RepID=A0A4V1NNP5_9ACTN|nr:hypothetical protein [Streptomyces sioyaensis]MBM4794847.1 hypothetical protein [Streptomyces sioyaensis]RXS58797.1 hypothetical protein EST54_31615 [Streptomyces sioyaensis]